MCIGLEDMFTGKDFSLWQKATITANRIVYWQTILHTNSIIVLTVTRRRMYCTSPRLEGDMITDDDRYFTIIKWMFEFVSFQRGADKCRKYLIIFNSGSPQHRFV